VNPTVALARALHDAAGIVTRVAGGHSLAEEFERIGESGSETPRGALIDLTHGTLRRYGRVQAIVKELSHRGHADEIVESLLWCALYAAESGRYSEYTVVDQAVRACGLLERWSAKGYVNALLRSYLRERGSLEARLAGDPVARYQHPRWWIDLLKSAYPAQWEAILLAGNSHPPMCLRVNRHRSSVERYQGALHDAGIGSRQVGEHALLLERGVPVDRLPGFAQGEVSVQDAGAQAAVHLLDLADGQKVLDACAAPGGKASHILETAGVGLTALDADRARCERMERNFVRIGASARVKVADCTAPADWWDGEAFDRILADVPCSASGIARRHPDLKWLRRAGDLAGFASRQLAILEALWPTLAPNGKLLYVTCSVFPRENEDVIDAFVARATGARRAALPGGGAAQRLPGPEHDGFFYALVEKRA
jgi:16S rRNA (cytosine967-C5)-methyltransferase